MQPLGRSVSQCNPPYTAISRKGCSEKVLATTPKGIVGGFEFTILQRNFKELHERPWTFVCDYKGKQKKK